MNNGETVESNGSVFKILEGLLYIGFVLLGFYLAFLVRLGMNPSFYNIQSLFKNVPYIVLTSIIVFYIYDIVSTFKKSLFENAVIIIISLILIDVITVAIVFFSRSFAFPRSVFLIGFVIQFSLIFITKFIILNIIKLNRVRKNILVIASEEEAENIVKKILLDRYNFDNIKYICNEINENTYRLIDYVEKVYIGSTIKNGDKLNIVSYCSENGKIIYLVPSLFEISLVGFRVSQASDLLVFKLENLGLTREQKFIKKLLDIVISFIGLAVALPVLAVISLIIKLYDKGPILYRQERITENNKIFNLYKFRTMVVDAEKYTGPVLSTEEDPRVTPIGRFLRASRIDELPQLFNVLKGDMSIVGPRPERPFFVEQFNKEVDEFKYRVFVKAGITGLAQILGTYSTNHGTKAKYDLLYIKNYSLLLDIKIILNTIKVVFMKNSSKGIAKEKRLSEMFAGLDLKVYEGTGVTRIG